MSSQDAVRHQGIYPVSGGRIPLGSDGSGQRSATGSSGLAQTIRDSQVGSRSIKSTSQPTPAFLKQDRQAGLMARNREVDFATQFASKFHTGRSFPTTPYPSMLAGVPHPHAVINDHNTHPGFRTNASVRYSQTVSGQEHNNATNTHDMSVMLGSSDQLLFWNSDGRPLGARSAAFIPIKILNFKARAAKNRARFKCVHQLLDTFRFAGNLSSVKMSSSIERTFNHTMTVENFISGVTEVANLWTLNAQDSSNGSTVWLMWVMRTEGWEQKEQVAADLGIKGQLQPNAPSDVQAEIDADFKKRYGAEAEKKLEAARYWRLEPTVTSGTCEINPTRYMGPHFTGAAIRIGRVVKSIGAQDTHKDLSRDALDTALYGASVQDMQQQLSVLGKIQILLG